LSSKAVFPRRNSGFRTVAIARLRHAVSRFSLPWRSWHFWQRLFVGVAGRLWHRTQTPGFDISLVVPAQEQFLILRVRPVAFLAARRTAHGPASEATDTDVVPLAKRSHHSTRILATAAHRSSTS